MRIEYSNHYIYLTYKRPDKNNTVLKIE